MKKILYLIAILNLFLQGIQASPQVDKFENYLNNLKTLSASFTQINNRGHKTKGTLHISRPGRLRLTYSPPSPLIVISDGEWLVSYDRQTQESNYVSLENTPAAFILRPHISFKEGVVITSLIPKGDTTEISLVRTDDSDAGTLSLTFTNNPVTLKEWRVIDAQGIETCVRLSDIKSNITLPSELFRIKSPTLIEQIF